MFEKVIADFRKNGFAVIPDFLDDKQVSDLKQRVHELVDGIDVTTERLATDDTLNPNIDVESADKIRFFFEKEAFDEKGNLVVDKHRALFRIGFALHCLDPTFKRVTFGDKVKQLVRELDFAEPRVAQSMYIFKNPEIGGLFIPHQDATYLHAVGDELREVGIWFALEDATEENGCLSFIPGSHKTGLHRQYVKSDKSNDKPFVFTNDSPDYNESDFIPAIAKKGSAVLIDGLVVHRSAQNRSQKGRPIYTFHLYDDSTCKWDEKNWLQPTPINPFPLLYTN
ncbi:phytanoyl-CoA dioxygenase domain-containing protein 1-like [Oppia nitens]|uniref:phytanoyl-CoA dioxygenase domain-containing protein 1-like n=1 Tax=Oppia nitens TaxID=1686743 RepID=UPI0023DCB408|nr:phytanoyl-CoA dioxygenase domain-containing protein 1-like [Oppia nitens]